MCASSCVRYDTYADEIAIIAMAQSTVTDIAQNHRGYDVPSLTSSLLVNPLNERTNAYDCHLLIIGLHSCSTEVLLILGWLNTPE